MKPGAALTARVPQIDWSRGFERHWNGGDPVSTHVFNALSFLFPRGERFFVEQAREVAKTLDLADAPALAAAVKAFVAQEAIHAHQHAQYNAVLEAQGYTNVSDDLARRREEHSYRVFQPLTRLAVVCAYEHYTAALGHFVLSNPQVLARAPHEMQLLWGWHCAEETEHKGVCFDLYLRAGGGWLRRVSILMLVSLTFTRLFWRLFLTQLAQDGCFRGVRAFGTLGRMLRFFAGPSGVGWYMLGAIARYLSPWFHPWKHDNRASMDAWLAANYSGFAPVSRTTLAHLRSSPRT